MRISINFVVALPSEAQPLINFFGLRAYTQARGVKLYERDNFRLVISGVGKAASAAAVGYLAGSAPADTRHVWLNIGIAGHAHLATGSTGLAHRIEDQSAGNAYYPAIAFSSPCPSYELVCYDAPTTTYAGEALCDMESAGFFAAASRFSTIEFVHCLKIVSDNSATSINSLNRSRISELVEANLEHVETVTARLDAIATTHLAQPNALPTHSLLERWHFTRTQCVQIAELARRWVLLREDHRWPEETLQRCSSARDVIAALSEILDRTPLMPYRSAK